MAMRRQEDGGTCSVCQHRADSIKAAERFHRIVEEHPERFPPGAPRIASDIAPKEECKRHQGYGYDVYEKYGCFDWTERSDEVAHGAGGRS